MIRYRREGAARFGALLLTFTLYAPAAAAAQQKPTVTPDDYDRFETLGPGVLSPDGRWLAVSIGRVSDEGELRIHRTDTDSVVAVPFGTRPSFSRDNRWVAYSIGVSPDDRKAAEKAKTEVFNRLGLLNLETGEQTIRDDFESFSFSDDGRYLAMRRYRPKDKKSEGVDVVVHDLASGSDMSFGNVSEMSWQDEGSLLAMVTDADDRVEAPPETPAFDPAQPDPIPDFEFDQSLP
ncbi:MAG: hypothetical protein O2958_15160, partial [Gemmatimonadetes bacterium]|nr:hypothetical protein [Gemmatimonadota bacterium]